MRNEVYVLLLAGGTGARMGAAVNKVLLPVAGIPCIARAAKAFEFCADRIVLVGRPEEERQLLDALKSVDLKTPVTFAAGGPTRQDSVKNGLKVLDSLAADKISPVLIHDGARCLVEESVISESLASIRRRGSGVAAIPATDTLRFSETEGRAGETVPRENLYAMQTPQGFILSDLLTAFDHAEKEGFRSTDDAAVMDFAGFPVFLTEGSRYNIKLTTKEDLLLAEALLQNTPFSSVRIGQGYDVHQLVSGRRLILCGVEIPYEFGLLGHSDADVALHALMDALLGAAGLGDIGKHFPDSDPAYLGIDSMLLLSEVVKKVRNAGYRPSNVDVTIVAQKPKLSGYIPAMAENLASALELPLSRVNVKATTTEHLGFEGRMEGISAQAVCMIQSIT